METVEFNPSIAHLNTLVENYSKLEIRDENDIIGYTAVKNAKKELADHRVTITKEAKSQRADFTAMQKKIIKSEKETIGLIQPLEKSLEAQLLAVDNIKALPERLQKLADIKVIGKSDELMLMSNREFTSFYKNAREAHFDNLQKIEDKKEADEAQVKRDEEMKAAGAAEAEEKLEQSVEIPEPEELKTTRQVESTSAYEEFLKNNNFNADTDLLTESDTETNLYRLVAILKK